MGGYIVTLSEDDMYGVQEDVFVDTYEALDKPHTYQKKDYRMFAVPVDTIDGTKSLPESIAKLVGFSRFNTTEGGGVVIDTLEGPLTYGADMTLLISEKGDIHAIDAIGLAKKYVLVGEFGVDDLGLESQSISV